MALVSDAGMPGISDPGQGLVAAASALGLRVESVPGPSAVTTALAVSGLPADSFLFLGFLPRRRRDRLELLRESAAGPRTLVAFEAPHRLRRALQDLAETVGDRPIAVCRELTKLHEETFRGTASAALEHFDSPRGEFVLVVSGSPRSLSQDLPVIPDRQEILDYLSGLRSAGSRSQDAVSEASLRFGITRNRAYQLWLETRP